METCCNGGYGYNHAPNYYCECRDTAYHEAGHAVVGIVLGARVIKIETRSIRGDEALAHVLFRKELPEPYEACIDLAGPIAELLAKGGRYLLEDDEEFTLVKERLTFEVAVSLIPEVNELLIKHWAKVELVARHLLNARRCGVVFGAEVHNLLKASI